MRYETQIQLKLEKQMQIQVRCAARQTKRTNTNKTRERHINRDVYVLLGLQESAIERTPEAADEQRAAAEQHAEH